MSCPLDTTECSKACEGRYSHGCRALPCRLAHRDHSRAEKRRIRRPDGAGIVKELVDATEARDHLLWLQARGYGYRRIAGVAGLTPYHVQKIRSGKTKRVTIQTAAKLLAVGTHRFEEAA